MTLISSSLRQQEPLEDISTHFHDPIYMQYLCALTTFLSPRRTIIPRARANFSTCALYHISHHLTQKPQSSKLPPSLTYHQYFFPGRSPPSILPYKQANQKLLIYSTSIFAAMPAFSVSLSLFTPRKSHLYLVSTTVLLPFSLGPTFIMLSPTLFHQRSSYWGHLSLHIVKSSSQILILILLDLTQQHLKQLTSHCSWSTFFPFPSRMIHSFGFPPHHWLFFSLFYSFSFNCLGSKSEVKKLCLQRAREWISSVGCMISVTSIQLCLHCTKANINNT